MSDLVPPGQPIPPATPTPSYRGWAIGGGALLALILVAAIGFAVVVRSSWARPAATPSGSQVPSASPSPPAGPPGASPAVALPAGLPVCGVHLGFLGALSGAGGQLGQSIEQGALLAIDRYNKLHPGCAVTLVRLDSAGDPAKARSLARQALRDTQLVGLIGPLFSGESETAVPLLNRAGLPVITPSASRDSLPRHGWRVFHRAIANDAEQGPAAAHYIRAELHADKVFVIDDGSAYGQLVAGGVRLRLGGAVVGTDQVPVGHGLSGTVQRVKTSGASVVYYGGYYDGAGPLLKKLRAAGVTATLVGGDGINDPGLASLAGGQDIDGTVATAPLTPATDPAFLAAFRSAYGEPLPYSGIAYDVANIFLLGIEHGAGTRATMLDFVNSYDGTGVAGGYRFTSHGELDPSRARVAILVFHGGQFEYERSEPVQ